MKKTNEGRQYLSRKLNPHMTIALPTDLVAQLPTAPQCIQGILSIFYHSDVYVRMYDGNFVLVETTKEYNHSEVSRLVQAVCETINGGIVY